MKPLYVPQSLLEQVIPRLSLCAQSVFFACLQKSGVKYHSYGISNSEIMRATGIKKNESVRKAKREIEASGIARFIENFTTSASGERRRDRDIFYPVFDLYEAMDKRDGKGMDADTERDRQAAKQVSKAVADVIKPGLDKLGDKIDKQGFDFSRLHKDLQQWAELLEFTGKYGKTNYFTAKPGTVAPAFVEEQFKKHGLSIVVKSA